MIELWVGGAVVIGGAVGYWLGRRNTDKWTNEAMEILNEATDGELRRVWDKAVKRVTCNTQTRGE